MGALNFNHPAVPDDLKVQFLHEVLHVIFKVVTAVGIHDNHGIKLQESSGLPESRFEFLLNQFLRFHVDSMFNVGELCRTVDHTQEPCSCAQSSLKGYV